MIEGRIGVAGLEEIRHRLGDLEGKAPSVLARAINRTTANIKKNMAQQASARYHVTNTDARKTIKASQANRSSLGALVASRGSPISLAKFKVSPNRPVQYSRGRPSPKVYKAEVRKGQGKDPLDGNPKSFIAVMKNGHKGVFTRTGRTDGLTRRERNTMTYNSRSRANRNSSHEDIIRENYGPSVPQMIRNEESMAFIQEDARSTLEKRLDAEISNILRKG